MNWFRTLRLKLFGILLAVVLGVMVVLSSGVGWLSIPVVGAALWAVVMTVNRVADRATNSCWTCGYRFDGGGDDGADGGRVCPKCGSLHQPHMLAMFEERFEGELSFDEPAETEVGPAGETGHRIA
jgi:hypothetical protein